VALVVYVGGLVAAGAFVAPALFATLQSAAGLEGRALAGAAFGEILRRVLVAGEISGVTMIVALTILRLFGPKPLSYGIRVGMLAAMVLATAYTAHVVVPEVDALRIEMAATPAGAAVADPRRVRFDQLHELSTTIVTAVAVLGIVVAAWEARE
jgi:hypothetical protein